MRENEEDEDRNFEMLTGLVQAIKQERLSPPLLPFQRELFEEIREMVRDQRSKLKDFLQYEDEGETKLSAKNFKYMIYNSEIEKVDYLLKTYLKTRLKKIQIYCFHLIKNESEAEQLLSDQQRKFLNNYARLRYQYFKDNVFKLLVKNYRDFKGVEIIFAKSQEEQRERRAFVDTKQSQVELKSPNLNEHVFAEVMTNPNQLRFGLDLHASNTNTEQMEVISPGTIVFGPFRSIAERFAPSQFRLI